MAINRSSDLKYSPQRIEGTIVAIKKGSNDILYGTINDGSKDYHFNAKSFDDFDYSVEMAEENDLVSFIPEEPQPNRLNARHIKLKSRNQKSEERLEPVIDDNPEYTSVDESSLYTFFTPGYHKYILDDKESFFEKAKFDSVEIEIVEKLSHLLHISSIKYHKARHGIVYPFCILGATDSIKEYVRGKHEFLLVFSCFNNEEWQQATLNVHKVIRQRNDVSERPLPNFYMLISNARDLLEKTKNTKGSADAAIIPLCTKEILSCDDEQLLQLLLDRFEEYYFANNMLSEKNAIEEDKLLFGNRGAIAQSIVERCIEKKHSGIFGLRRSGKSSVLNAVIRRLNKQGIKSVTFSSGLIETESSWKTALYAIAREVRKTCLGIEQEELNLLTRGEESLLLKLNSTEKDYEKNAYACFKEDIRKYTYGEKTFVLAIDEIEGITYNTTTSAVWRNLEAYRNFWLALRDSFHDAGCSLIVCGVNASINEKSFIEFNGKTCENPMYERIENCSGFSKTYLPAFTDEQTKEMINTLGGYSNIAFDKVYAAINKTFGGQPYAIRQFCSFAYEKVKQNCRTLGVYQLKPATCDQLLDEFIRTGPGRNLISTILEYVRIYPEEYNTLKKIALSPDKYRSFDLTERGLIDHLEKYGIINYDIDTGFVSFSIEPIQGYIKSKESKDPNDMDNSERRRHIQDRVAECERKLKRFILNYFTYNEENIPPQKARQIMKNYAMIQEEYKSVIDPETCELDEFFDHKKFILYFSDLRKILCENWSKFKPAFLSCNIDKDQLSTYLKELNAGRTDADHYDAEDLYCPEEWEIDEKTMNDFQHGYEAIKQFFLKKRL